MIARELLMRRLLNMSKTASRKGLYEFLECRFSAIPRGARVLSVGAGGKVNERLDAHARSRDFQVTSFDIDQARGPDVTGDICTHDLGEEQFDVVVISEVLEHVHSPHLAIANLHRMLVPGGDLILTTPFILPIHERPYDYYRYTRFGLEFLLREFRNVNVRERNSYFEAIDVLWMRLLQVDGRVPRAVIAVVLPFVWLAKRPLTWLFGNLVATDAMTTGYVVTAVK